MKRLFHIAFLISISIILKAQPTVIDSLLQTLDTHKKEDTGRVYILNEISAYYENTDPIKGIEYADQAIHLAERLKTERMLSSGYFCKGKNYHALGKDSLALDMFSKALVLVKKNNLKSGEAKILTTTGLVFAEQADYLKALDYYLKALKILDETPGNHSIKADLSLNIGIVYKNLSRYKEALASYNNVAILYQELKDTVGMGYLYGNIATVYSAMSNNERAKEYYLKALDINNKLGNKKLAGSNLYNLGSLSREAADYENAWTYLEKAHSIVKSLGLRAREGMCLTEMANIYAFAPRSFFIKHHIPYNTRLSKAVNLTLKSLNIAIKTDDLIGIETCWANLSGFYKQAHDYPKALDAYTNYIKYRDSIINEDKKTEIVRKEMQYEHEKKEAISAVAHQKESAIIYAEAKRQQTLRNAAVAGIVILLASGLISFFFYKRKRDADIRARIAEVEMTALRAQMNPHFIFNSLNSIRNYIQQNKPSEADSYLTRFAKLMRHVLENSEQKEVSLKEDLTVLKWYIELELIRLKNMFCYQINVSEDIDQENVLIPPLILQPFVENSIWHGLSALKETGELSISIMKTETALHCIIEDNGTGRSTSTVPVDGQKNRNSLGIKLTQERIKLLQLDKKITNSVFYEDLPKGTRAEIIIPLRYNL